MPTTRSSRLPSCLLAAVGLCSSLMAGEGFEPLAWPSFRGPDQMSGTVPGAAWLATWREPVRLWSAEAGKGMSGLAVADGRVFTLGNQNGQDRVSAWDAVSGRSLWSFPYPCTLQPEWGSYSTPTVAGDRVFVLGKEGQLFCLEAAGGKVLWQQHLGEAGFRPPTWGFAGSPLIVGGIVVLNVGFQGVAYQAGTGKLVWSSNGLSGAGYATPVPVTVSGGQAVILFTAAGLKTVDLMSGALLWQIPWKTEYDVNAATPILFGNGLFVSSGYKVGGALFELDGNQPRQVWKKDHLTTQRSAGVLVGEFLYGVSASNSQPGELRCVAIRTGELRWSEPGFGQGTLIAAGEHLLVLGERGEYVLTAATPEGFRPRGRKMLLNATTCVPPVLADGRLYVRENQGRVECWELARAR